MENVLYIDTSSNQCIVVSLKQNKKTVAKLKSSLDQKKAQIILPLIDQLLLKNKISLTQLTAIEVNTGPGSFTGLRVGIAVANALSYALKIPINHKKKGQYETPKYE